MFVPRQSSPLSFEPLSPSSSDVAFGSDSDNELDETARVAKRRRIEELGKGYLEGKQLFILSAGLKGPFEDGWKNPWRRIGSRPKERTRSTRRDVLEREPPNPVVVPESVSRLDERRLHSAIVDPPVARLSRATPHISDSEAGSRRPSESIQSPLSQVVTSRYFANCTRHSTTSNSNDIHVGLRQGNAKGSKDLGTNWLKKDKKGVHRRVINPPKSPSPTPVYRPSSRPGSRHKPNTEIPEVQESSKAGLIAERRISGFTPINAQVKQPVAPASLPAVREKPAPKQRNTKPRKKAPLAKDESKFSKPVAPASARGRGVVRGAQRGDGSKKPQSASNSAENDANRRGSLHVLPSADHLPEFEYYRTDKSLPEANSKPVSHPPTQGTQGTEVKSSHAQSFETKSRKNMDKLGTSAKRAEPKSKHPSAQNSHDPNSATTESDNITSAQIVPHFARSTDVAFSLTFTEPAGSANNAAEGQPDTYDDGFSTQAAVALAQKTLQDDLASPEKATLMRTDLAHTPPQITPFHAFQTPSRIAARNAIQSAGGQPTSTQAIINAISPFDISTVKKAQPVVFNEELADGPRTKAVSFESPTEHRRKSGPPSAESQHNVDFGDVAIPFLTQKTRRASISGPSKLSEDTSARSTGTAIPWTLSASTGGTRPEDGQGGIDNFDLNQALAEAGTFLQQSFDFERDLSFLSHKGASPDKALQSFVSVNREKRS